MTNLGVFRDEYYNAATVLTEAAAIVGPAATGVIPASEICGAQHNFVSVSGTSQTFTTDSAANIIAYIQQAVAVAQKANVGGFASALGSTPPLGAPNFFNFTWILEINTAATVTGATLAYGSGVTATAIGGLSTTTLTPAGATNAVFVCTVTGPASVSMVRVQ